MTILTKLSFRQLLLGVFLLIAILLSAASVHALLTLDRLAVHSRETSRQAIILTANVQRLDERSIAMERSARQFLVLNDPAFRNRFADAWQAARSALDVIAAGLPGVAPEAFAAWHTHSEAAWAVLQGGQGRRAARQNALNRALAPLQPINERLAAQVQREVERRNQQLLLELDQRRSELTGQVLASIGLAALLALGFGLWLARPLAQIEKAIGRLGANRFDHAIEVRGPSDLRRVGQQLDWLRRRLGELEADKARFLRHISHELKTPLAAMREGVALLEDGLVGVLSPGQAEIAAILRQNTASLQTQIEDLLRYNAANFDAQHLKRETVDLGALLRAVIETQRLQWQARALDVVVEGDARALQLDPDKIGVALANLLSNAVRFSPRGGTIGFALSNAGARVLLECRDQGPGVAAADAARVFEPFYQGERQPPGARLGNGIGLSIVREYVAAHGGAIHLLPSAAGAHFQIELPHEK